MELNTLNRVIAVAQPHYKPVVGFRSYGQDIGYRRALHNERVIPSGLDGVGKSGENSIAGVADDRCLAVHNLRGPNHLSSEYLAKALQPEAHSEHRPDTTELLDEGIAQPGIGRTPRSGADENAVGIQIEGLIE